MDDYIILDLNKQRAKFHSNRKTYVRQGEVDSAPLSVQITLDGEPYDLTDAEVFFEAVRTDGHKYVEAASITSPENGFISHTVPAGLMVAHGRTQLAYFSVYKGDSIISTETMDIVTLPGVCFFTDSDYIPYIEQILAKLEEYVAFGESTQEILQDLLSQATQAISDANEATNTANDAAAQVDNAIARATDDVKALETRTQQAEKQRQSNETLRKSNESERVETEAQRVIEFSDLLSQWEAIRSQLNTYNTYMCKKGEYDPATGDIQLEVGVPGTIYLTPRPPREDLPSADAAPVANVLLEWLWIDEITGIEDMEDQPAHFEYIGSTQVTMSAITPEQIDKVMADENPISDDDYLSLSGVSNWWSKLKTWAASTFRKAADKIQAEDIADGTITTTQILDGTITIDDLAEAVVKRITDLETQTAENKSAWDSLNQFAKTRARDGIIAAVFNSTYKDDSLSSHDLTDMNSWRLGLFNWTPNTLNIPASGTFGVVANFGCEAWKFQFGFSTDRHVYLRAQINDAAWWPWAKIV